MIFLIDHENINLKNVTHLGFQQHDHIYIFDNGHTITKKIEKLILKLESKQIIVDVIQGVRISGTHNAKNEIDLQLAFTLAQLLNQYPRETFTIVSRDRAFETLVRFAKRTTLTAEFKIINISNNSLTVNNYTTLNNALVKSKMVTPQQTSLIIKRLKDKNTTATNVLFKTSGLETISDTNKDRIIQLIKAH